MSSSSSHANLQYREVARPPLWLMAFIYFMLASLVLAMWAALDNRAATITGVISLALGLLFYFAASREISLDQQWLRVGRAHIDRKYLGAVTVLESSEFIATRTRLADPAAHFALIFWISRGIKVEINDPRDKTPYWLISTRNGEKLAQTLKS